MKTVLFDLDNTLYCEETYVKSGFKAVSDYLAKKYGLNNDELFLKMMDIFNKEGRGKVFNFLIEDLKLNENILNLVYVYRYHFPNIELYQDSMCVLEKLKKDFKLGLITDGRVFVQKRKVEALNIEKYFDVIIFTDILGDEFWKPSVEPYKLALDLLKSKPEESVYIGDDPYKDFKAPIELGMKSIQVKMEDELDYWKKRGYKKFDADFNVDNLKDVLGVIYENWK